METNPRWILRNIARRPLELHGPAGVEIIPPDGSIEVETLSPQCGALVGRGLLSQVEAPAPEQADAECAPKADAPAPRRRAATKSRGTKSGSRQRAATAAEDKATSATGLRKGEGE